MTSSELDEKFGIPGILRFEDHGGLTSAHITLSDCEATVYLQGAQLTHWQPVGTSPVIFLSERSSFTPGTAIRGGIPLCFPWFGARSDGAPGPSHGFARLEPWELAFAALVPDAADGDRVQLTFVLSPTEMSDALGYHDFRVACEMMLGHSLTMRLTVANFGDGPLRFEEALHTYFHVDDIHRTAVVGLEGAAYLDKRDNNQKKFAPDERLALTEWTDRVFPANKAELKLHDPGNRRLMRISKQNSMTTIVWNPWSEGAAGFPDLGADEWQHFIAVESGNTGTDAITLQPDATHTMTVAFTVEPL